MRHHNECPDPSLRGQPEPKGGGGHEHHSETGQAIGAEMRGCHRLSLGVDRDRDRPCASAEHDLAHRLRRPARHGKALAGEGQNKAKAQGQDRVQGSHQPEI